jgi:hypothetical protein
MCRIYWGSWHSGSTMVHLSMCNKHWKKALVVSRSRHGWQYFHR